MVAEFEVFEDVLYIGRESVEPSFEIGFELLRVGTCPKVAQGERGDVVEGLARRLPQRRVLLHDFSLVERGFHVADGLLVVLQHRIEPPQHRHRQDHVAILAANVQITQDIVRDSPDVVGDPVQVSVVQLAAPCAAWCGA